MTEISVGFTIVIPGSLDPDMHFGLEVKWLIINISVSSGLFPRHREWYSITSARFYRHPPYASCTYRHTLSNVDLYTAVQRQYLLTCKVSRYCRLPLHGSILVRSGKSYDKQASYRCYSMLISCWSTSTTLSQC